MSVLPTFLTGSFSFEGEPPRHIDEFPRVPRYAGCYALFGVVLGNKPYSLAVDVPDEEMARLLADARARKQEETISLYGYTDDVYLLFPNNKNERTYCGRERDD